MKKLLLLSCFVFVLLLGTRAKANILDPTIGIGDPSCGSWNPAWGPITDETTSTFSFTTNGTDGFYGFCNKSGSTWTALEIKFYNSGIVDPMQPLDKQIDCSTTVFNGCTMSLANNIVTLDFGAIEGCGPTDRNCGIPSFSNDSGGGEGSPFYMWIDLYNNGCNPSNGDTCTPSDIGWPSNLTFENGVSGTNAPTPTPPPVPEPASILLVGSGVAAIWQMRRKRRS